MQKNITETQLNDALDALKEFFELLPVYGKTLFQTDVTIYVGKDPDSQKYLRTKRHLVKNVLIVEYKNITVTVIRMRNTQNGAYLYGYDDVFLVDGDESIRISGKDIMKVFQNNSKSFGKSILKVFKKN